MHMLLVVITAIRGTLSDLRVYASDREARQRGPCWT